MSLNGHRATEIVIVGAESRTQGNVHAFAPKRFAERKPIRAKLEYVDG